MRTSRKVKQSKIISRVIMIVCLCIMLFILPENYRTRILTIVTAVAALAVFWEIKENHDLASGQFVFDLEQSFESNQDCKELFIKCWEFKSRDNTLDLSSDTTKILNYLTFFESMYVLYMNGAISIKELDDLFGRRFMSIVNNRAIQEIDLVKNYKYYLNIYRLYNVWKKYRIKSGKEENKPVELFDESYCEEKKNDPAFLEQFEGRFEDLEKALREKASGDEECLKYCDEIFGK